MSCREIQSARRHGLTYLICALPALTPPPDSSCSHQWPPPKTNVKKPKLKHGGSKCSEHGGREHSPGSDLRFNPRRFPAGDPDAHTNVGWCDQICQWMRERIEDREKPERERMSTRNDEMNGGATCWISTLRGSGLSSTYGRRVPRLVGWAVDRISRSTTQNRSCCYRVITYFNISFSYKKYLCEK